MKRPTKIVHPWQRLAACAFCVLAGCSPAPEAASGSNDSTVRAAAQDVRDAVGVEQILRDVVGRHRDRPTRVELRRAGVEHDHEIGRAHV